MKPYYQDDHVTLHHGDCIETMRGMPENSVDSIVTDPPYGLGFMGKKWDSLPPGEEWARECLRVLKPGGHILAFGGSRTWHRLAVAIEDAGFEIRDGVLWLYGSGFPKSHDISKAIDKMAGAEREVIGVDHLRQRRNPNGKGGTMRLNGFSTIKEAEEAASRGEKAPNGRNAAATVANYYASAERLATLTAPATDAAKQWSGWGTALKPAYEPAVMARKPFTGTVARNVLEHGTGAINIDACRIATSEVMSYSTSKAQGATGFGTGTSEQNPSGRFPANLILDEHTAELLDEQSGVSKSTVGKPRSAAKSSPGWGMTKVGREHNDEGGASRFFYVAKAPKSERPVVDGVAHATVKPLKLMRYLVRMVTPPGGTVLEPFAGSGTTIEAALIEGFNVIGIEMEPDYLPLIQHRINRVNI